MDFSVDLIQRIRTQIGLEPDSDEAFSMLHPSGNDHLVQFYFKNLDEAYFEFDEWDRHNLFLCDLTKGLGFEFVLDEDGQFATLRLSEASQVRTVEAIMDLRDDYLVTIYYFGDAKTSQRFNQQLMATERLCPCYVGTVLMEQLICELETINRVDYEFEQLSSSFLEPVVLKGSVIGKLSQTVFGQYTQNYRSFFNIKSIGGQLSDDTQGHILFFSGGMIQMTDCRLSDVMKLSSQLFYLLRMKYKSLVEKCLMTWETTDGTQKSLLTGNLIEICLGQSMDKVDGLLKFLTRGDKTLTLMGISERVSRKLWSIKTVHVETGARVECEISTAMLRVYLMDRLSIPLLDKIEDFLQRHITVDFENLVY